MIIFRFAYSNGAFDCNEYRFTLDRIPIICTFKWFAARMIIPEFLLCNRFHEIWANMVTSQFISSWIFSHPHYEWNKLQRTYNPRAIEQIEQKILRNSKVCVSPILFQWFNHIFTFALHTSSISTEKLFGEFIRKWVELCCICIRWWKMCRSIVTYHEANLRMWIIESNFELIRVQSTIYGIEHKIIPR